MNIDRRTAIAIAAGGLAATAVRGQPGGGALDPGREVLAFYYGWYGNPATSHRWRHWQGPSAGLPPGQVLSVEHPTLGLYDSHDPALIARHADMLKQAGVTGIISSWWGQTSFEETSLAMLLDIMHSRGLKVCAYVEQEPGGQAGANSDLTYLVKTHASHPAWLRVGGRPVIFIYLQAVRALRKLPGASWRTAADAVRAAGLPEPIIIGDVAPRDDVYAQEAAQFDGTHTYVMAPYIGADKDHPDGLNPDQIAAYTRTNYPAWKQKAQGKIYVATIDPGFDDRLVPGRPAPRPVIGRYGTKTFDTLWRAAIDTRADWVVITSFNEWHEGSEIEPSTEFGDTFLKANARWARAFLAS